MNRKEIVKKLRHPMWAHGDAPFDGPQLDKETVVDDMVAAADLIDALVNALEEIARQKLSAEIEADEEDAEASPDYEFGYDEIVRTARTALNGDVGQPRPDREAP